ncbi:MAG: hypothetical protein KDE04_02555 [Anaerolineales bacterium]|nr:hypothetical protein [Anaerolineales bacterium]MCB8962773.1 hypothetical protein [Ardenticatenales bacterium]
MSNFDDEVLLACLDALEAGQDPDLILAQYPDQAEAIRPILLIERELSGLSLAPAAGAQARSETLFLAAAASMKAAAARPAGGLRWWQPLLAVLGGLAVLLVIGFGSLRAAADALPGDALYPVKRLNESAQLKLFSSPQERLQLEESFELERISEVERLLSLGRNEAVECTGTIEVLAFDYIEIYGLKAEFADKVVVNGKLELGAFAEIQGRTEDGHYIAEVITIIDEDHRPLQLPAGEPTATSEPTETPEPTATSEPTETSTPSPTATDEGTPTLEPTETATATPTVTATASPTTTAAPTDVVVTPDDDDDDDCDNSGSGNNCDDDDDDDDGGDDGDGECDSSGSGNNCDDDDGNTSNSGSGSSNSGSGSGNSGSGGGGGGGDDD